MCFGVLESILGTLRVITLASVTDMSGVEVTEWHNLLAGFKNNQEQLRTGVYRATGRLLDDSPAERVIVRRELEVFCAFDNPEDMFRFDWRELKQDSDKTIRPLFDGRYARARDRSLHHYEGHRDLSVEARGSPPRIMTFDIRALGLCYLSDFEKGTSLAKILDLYRAQTPDEVSGEGKGIFRVRWRLARDHRRTLWIDENCGFSTTRFEVVDGVRNDPLKEWDDPAIVSDTTWVKISDVWVVRTFSISQRLQSGRVTRYDLAFEWESVNEPVNESHFTVNGMSLPTGTYVLDSRLGKPIITAVVGRSTIPEVGIIESRENSLSTSSGRTTWVVLLSGGVILAVAGSLLVRRFWHRAS